MEADVELILSDGRGLERRIVVSSSRFTIGRDPDNDLALDDDGASRRHALIEKFDGVVQISDCGSRKGTAVNGRLIGGATVLRDGDTILIGDACSITVYLNPRRASAGGSRPVPQAGEGGDSRGARSRATSSLSVPVIAIAAALALLGLGAVIALLSGTGERRTAGVRDTGVTANDSGSRLSTDDANQGTETDPSRGAVAIEQVERAAVQVMRRVSSDDRPYVFPANAVAALSEISRKIDSYRDSPALVTALGAFVERGSVIAAEARREGIEPYLVIYVALAEMDGGRTGSDALAVARQVLPKLQSLRATFGTEQADKSLIIVAAYRMSGGTKKSHPLLATMRRMVKDPQNQRNVWYLHERGGLDDEVFDFVVRFMALGIIAQNPRQFGIAAAPLAF